MALREIRINGDPVLAKECKPVENLTDRLNELIDDMIETMHEADGVGLAAPQVGILRRICVIDLGEKYEMEEPLVLINPEVVEKDGEQTGQEGCLSLPGYTGEVTRPMKVKVKALNRDMQEIEVEGEELLARALCHEIDHLNGHMYTELVNGSLREVEQDDEEDED